MGDRRPERAGRRRHRVDVDALAILGRVRERIDALLVDLEPAARAEARAGIDHAASPQRTTLAAQV